ncbi:MULTISPECIES: L-threonylcarbamoyladenylate synthase [Bartonella]|uniref:Threonylcarbamoyl-AMP synthase n=1 Tax=Bartonella choladocola TaxID=2750995 RepID=A0A1U9MGR2_9HYPH|nr:L-threonylcarbamoyladenylate synthase [Bartonella choladocola]AQT46821.1 translation factor SUA5 [Bartonella choladocola]MBI0140177.1 threonylcarbamoyl-AMP synthase [Bartonella choladocola]
MIILASSKDAVSKAVSYLDKGELVALPTETVYGLAADATNGKAVANIFKTKGRPQFNPLIAHVSGVDMAEDIVEIDAISQKLMDTFWPGPLTLVLPLKNPTPIDPLTSAGLKTLAVRNPVGIFATIVKELGRPVAAPSANISGRLSSTTAQDVADMFGEKVPLIIDGGATRVGVESTIIKVMEGRILLLRPGGLATGEIEKVTGLKLERVDQRAAIEAPGMLKSHYAPNAFVRLDAKDVKNGEALLAFGKQQTVNAAHAVATLNLSERGNLEEAASNLFHYLKELDRKDVECIAVEPIPFTGLGEAINDRLQRAAAPRK